MPRHVEPWWARGSLPMYERLSAGSWCRHSQRKSRQAPTQRSSWPASHKRKGPAGRCVSNRVAAAEAQLVDARSSGWRRSCFLVHGNMGRRGSRLRHHIWAFLHDACQMLVGSGVRPCRHSALCCHASPGHAAGYAGRVSPNAAAAAARLARCTGCGVGVRAIAAAASITARSPVCC